jgi:hypothetical protein
LSTTAHSMEVVSELAAKIGEQYVSLQVKYGEIMSELGTLKSDSANLVRLELLNCMIMMLKTAYRDTSRKF